MTRWLVTLTGAEADLERLVRWHGGEDWQIICHEKRGTALCGPWFDAFDDYEIVGCMAEKLILLINRSARYQISDFQDVSRDKIIEQRQGRGHVIVPVGLAATASAAASIGWVKMAPDGTIIETSKDRAKQERQKEEQARSVLFPRLVTLQKAYPDLAEALRYLEEEPDMYGFYKVSEAILRALGNPKKRWDVLVELGWTSDEELRRFTKSTHTKRHHSHAGPQQPMTVPEAGAYARELLDRLIAHLDNTTP